MSEQKKRQPTKLERSLYLPPFVQMWWLVIFGVPILCEVLERNVIVSGISEAGWNFGYFVVGVRAVLAVKAFVEFCKERTLESGHET